MVVGLIGYCFVINNKYAQLNPDSLMSVWTNTNIHDTISLSAATEFCQPKEAFIRQKEN